MADYVISPASFFKETIDGNPSTDYHRQYLFRVHLPNDVDNTLANVVTYFVASSQSPVETTGMIAVDWMNSQVKIGGRTLYAEWTVTVRDDAKSAAYRFFRAWRKQVYETASGQSSIPVEYKHSLDLYLLDNRGETQRGYKLVGAFPTSIGQMTLDYSTENIITFPVTIQYDEFQPIV